MNELTPVSAICAQDEVAKQGWPEPSGPVQPAVAIPLSECSPSLPVPQDIYARWRLRRRVSSALLASRANQVSEQPV